jgi:hypothetical protein
MGNPFLEPSKDLLVLDSRDIADPGVAQTVRTVEKIGKQQYETFVKERLDKRTMPLSEPITRNKLILFSIRHKIRSVVVLRKCYQITSRNAICSSFNI